MVKKAKVARWRPSMAVVRGLQIEIHSLQMVIAKGADDHAREVAELRNRIDDLETQFMYLEDLIRSRSWGARFVRLFSFGQ